MQFIGWLGWFFLDMYLNTRQHSEMPRVPGWDEGSSNTGHAICLLQELHDGQRVLIIAFDFLTFFDAHSQDLAMP